MVAARWQANSCFGHLFKQMLPKIVATVVVAVVGIVAVVICFTVVAIGLV